VPVFEYPAVRDDLFLDLDTGDVYRAEQDRGSGVNSYKLVGCLRGPQGPQGERGAAGVDGKDGERGPEGPAGAPGSVWRRGSGEPANSLGVDGDFYLDTDTEAIYVRVAGGYVFVADLAGHDGEDGLDGRDGDPGKDGAVWRSGPGTPSTGTGADGDYYLRVSNGDVFERQAGAYVIVGNIRGPAGDARS
jgi:hypothetical protein